MFFTKKIKLKYFYRYFLSFFEKYKTLIYVEITQLHCSFQPTNIMSTPVVKNVSKPQRESEGYSSFGSWVEDTQNNLYIGANASKYTGMSMPESKWVMPMGVQDSVGTSKDWMMKKILKIYEEYVRNNSFLMNSLPELKNKNLGCWCHPRPCHGDVLVKLYQEVCEKPTNEKKEKKQK